jgi:hypothetical protein
MGDESANDSAVNTLSLAGSMIKLHTQSHTRICREDLLDLLSDALPS